MSNIVDSDRRKFLAIVSAYGLVCTLPGFVYKNNMFGDELGQNTSGAGETLDPNKYYFLLNADLSGAFRYEGLQQLMAANIAVEELNKYKVFDKEVRIVISDNQCDAQATKNSLKKIFDQPHSSNIIALVGGSSSHTTKIQAEIATAQKLVHLAGVAQLSEAGQSANPTFTVFMSVEESAKALLHSAQAKKYNKILALSHDYDWGRAQVTAQSKAAGQVGISYENTFFDLHFYGSDLGRAISDESLVSADAIIINQYGLDLLKTLAFLKANKLAEGKTIYLPSISDSVRKAADPGLFAGVEALVNWNDQIDSQSSHDFSNHFYKVYGTRPGQAAHQVFAQLSLFITSFGETKSFAPERISSVISTLSSADVFGLKVDFSSGAGFKTKKDLYLIKLGAQNEVVSSHIIAKEHLV